MSTVSTDRPAKPLADDSDPYYYGWRYVTVRQPDGTETLDQVPLTLEDVLFPETGDVIVQTYLHNRDIAYLKYVCDARIAHIPAHAGVRLPGGLEPAGGQAAGARRRPVLQPEPVQGLGDAGRSGRRGEAGDGGGGDLAPHARE